MTRADPWFSSVKTVTQFHHCRNGQVFPIKRVERGEQHQGKGQMQRSQFFGYYKHELKHDLTKCFKDEGLSTFFIWEDLKLGWKTQMIDMNCCTAQT